jgi:two-component system phosphate regulon sensor histidine kinase PhoR
MLIGRLLVGLAVVMTIAFGLSQLVGDTATWIVMSGALVLAWIWQHWQVQRLERWAERPNLSPPVATGALGAPILRLYQHWRQRERQVAQLEEAVLGFQIAAQALPDGVVTLDRDLRIEWCNRQALYQLGLRLPADRGQLLLNLVRDPRFVRYAQGSDWAEPVMIRTGGPDDRHLQLQLIAYGRRQRLLLTRDMTQVERLETTRRDFVANVSHELRTPLTVLSGFLETLIDWPDDAPRAQQAGYLKLMLDQAQRMQQIVADLLTLSTLESTPQAAGRPVAMDKLMANLRASTAALSGGRHELHIGCPPGLKIIGAEPELLSAFGNLLSNAVRYTPAGGHIEAGARLQPDGSLVFAVRDSGPGIEAKHIPRLTERFYRVDTGRSREVGGTGLGLAIVKHVAMRHEAELLIESEVGKGSCFTLRFPANRVIQSQDTTR